MEKVPISTWMFILVPSVLTYIAAIYYYRNYRNK